ncbi:MAG TPA: hypothetical protein VHT73_03105 [Thermodesulfobacteriota bacterium]|nr:hypothetical protein [Thermodesulfobacteriota bacterium]
MSVKKKEGGEKVTVRLKLFKDVWVKAKALAMHEGKSIDEVVEQELLRWVRSMEARIGGGGKERPESD